MIRKHYCNHIKWNSCLYFQIGIKGDLVLAEGISEGQIPVTLTTPFACAGAEPCSVQVLSFTPPDAVKGNCRVSSMKYGDNCGTFFHSKDLQLPATKYINIRAIAGDSAQFQSREFAVFLMTGQSTSHAFMSNKLLGVVRVSVLDYISSL